MKTNKKEWNDKDFNRVNKAIQNYFGGKYWVNHRNERIYFPGNFYEIEKILGLPYTSTSDYAMLSLDCNVNINSEIDGYIFDHIYINSNDVIVLALRNIEEDYKYIRL